MLISQIYDFYHKLISKKRNASLVKDLVVLERKKLFRKMS